MNWKFIAVVGVLVAAIAVAGYIIYDDNKVSDAETEMWTLFEEQDDRICKIENDTMIPLENLDGLEFDDEILIGKKWMENHNDAATKERISQLVDDGIRVMTLGDSLLAFESFMTDHCYEFEEEAYIHGVQMRNGVVFTLSLTASDDETADRFLSMWDTYMIPNLFKDPFGMWDLRLQSYSIRQMWDADDPSNYMIQTKQYLADSDSTGKYVTMVDKYASNVNDGSSDRNYAHDIGFDLKLSGDSADRVVDYAPTADNFTDGNVSMDYHGNVVLTNPQFCNSFKTISDDDGFSMTYGVNNDNRNSNLTLYPAYMVVTDGEYTAHADTSLVVEKDGEKDKLKYTYGSDVQIIL